MNYAYLALDKLTLHVTVSRRSDRPTQCIYNILAVGFIIVFSSWIGIVYPSNRAVLVRMPSSLPLAFALRELGAQGIQ